MTRVLLVDDDLSFRRSLMIQLELEGYQVLEAESGKDALSILETSERKGHFPDIVITDMKMPEMDGTTLVDEVKMHYPIMPIILMSAYEPPETIDEKCFLHKPFKINEIMATMNNAINVH